MKKRSGRSRVSNSAMAITSLLLRVVFRRLSTITGCFENEAACACTHRTDCSYRRKIALVTYGEEPRNSSTRSSDIIISDKTKCDIQIKMFLHFLINIVEDIHGRQLMHVKCIECDLLLATRCDIPVSYGLYWFLVAAKYAKNWKREALFTKGHEKLVFHAICIFQTEG